MEYLGTFVMNVNKRRASDGVNDGCCPQKGLKLAYSLRNSRDRFSAGPTGWTKSANFKKGHGFHLYTT